MTHLRQLGLRREVDAAALMEAVDSLESCKPSDSSAADRSAAVLEEFNSWADKGRAPKPSIRYTASFSVIAVLSLIRQRLCT